MVFNAGDWMLGEGKDFDIYGDCIDFNVPLNYTTGIEKIQSDDINIYPNPVNNILNIKSKVEIESYIIFNSVGEEISYNNHIEDYIVEINVKSLNQGLYIIYIFDREGSQKSFKFLK